MIVRASDSRHPLNFLFSLTRFFIGVSYGENSRYNFLFSLTRFHMVIMDALAFHREPFYSH